MVSSQERKVDWGAEDMCEAIDLLFWEVFYAAEADVISGGEGLVKVASSGAIAEAVFLGAEVGAPFDDVEVEEGGGVGRHVRVFSFLGEGHVHALRDWFGRATGVGLGIGDKVEVSIGAKVVAAQFPDVPRHVVEAVAIGGERSDGSTPGVAVFGSVPVGKFTLEDIREVLVIRAAFISPRVILFFEPPSGSVFPFSLGRETFAGPLGISPCIGDGEAGDGVVEAVSDAGAGAFGLLPVGVGGEVPPRGDGASVFEVGGAVGSLEDHYPRKEHFGGGEGEFLFRKATFGLRLVASSIDEFFEVGVGDLMRIDEKRADGHAMGRAFFGVLLGGFRRFSIASTSVGSSRNISHCFWGVGMTYRVLSWLRYVLFLTRDGSEATDEKEREE